MCVSERWVSTLRLMELDVRSKMEHTHFAESLMGEKYLQDSVKGEWNPELLIEFRLLGIFGSWQRSMYWGVVFFSHVHPSPRCLSDFCLPSAMIPMPTRPCKMTWISAQGQAEEKKLAHSVADEQRDADVGDLFALFIVSMTHSLSVS